MAEVITDAQRLIDDREYTRLRQIANVLFNELGILDAKTLRDWIRQVRDQLAELDEHGEEWKR